QEQPAVDGRAREVEVLTEGGAAEVDGASEARLGGVERAGDDAVADDEAVRVVAGGQVDLAVDGGVDDLDLVAAADSLGEVGGGDPTRAVGGELPGVHRWCSENSS